MLVIVLVLLALFTFPAILVGGVAVAYFFVGRSVKAPQAPGLSEVHETVETLANPVKDVEYSEPSKKE